MTDQPTPSLAERLSAILALCHRYGRVQPPDPGLVESIRNVAVAAHADAVKVDAWMGAENVDSEVWRREAMRARAEAETNRKRWIAAAEIADAERSRRHADESEHADWRAWAETTYERSFDDGRSSARLSDAELMQAIASIVADATAWRTAGTAMANAAESPRGRVFADISAERERQDAKWGPVRKQPNVDPVLAARGADHEEISAAHFIPTAELAKRLFEIMRKEGRVSFTHIVVEELAEAVEVHDDPVRLREELVQVAASVVKWIEALDLPEVAP